MGRMHSNRQSVKSEDDHTVTVVSENRLWEVPRQGDLQSLRKSGQRGEVEGNPPLVKGFSYAGTKQAAAWSRKEVIIHGGKCSHRKDRGNKNTHTDTAFSEAEFFFCSLMNDQFSGSLFMPLACFSSAVLMGREEMKDGCLQRWSFKKGRLSREFFRISLRDLHQMCFKVQKEENACAQKHPCEV